jgi:ADP-ribosyl-[dinitrogen reductase] hydrolase
MKQRLIIGAIAGDVIGSVYEKKENGVKTIDFPLFSDFTSFTDDTVLTVATMDCLLNNLSYFNVYHLYGNKYPDKGYGSRFKEWLKNENPVSYDSNGNGSAMRVSPIGWAYNNIDEIMTQARKSAEVTHNHPDAIIGAQAIAIAVFCARHKMPKDEIKMYLKAIFPEYNLNRTIAEIRPTYQFDTSCAGSVPEAIIAFLESTDYESAIRLAISLGGDSDTLACMAGAIAEAFYGEVPENISEGILRKLYPEMVDVITKFSIKYKK